MSQSEILTLLKKNPNKWFSRMDIANKIGKDSGSISLGVSKLIRWNEVEVKYENDYKNGKRFVKYKNV